MYDYNLVKNWATARGLNVLDADWVILPLHLPMHWVLVVLALKSREGVLPRKSCGGIVMELNSSMFSCRSARI